MKRKGKNIALALAIFVCVAHAQAQAREVRVTVTKTDGVQEKGRLLRVDEQALVLGIGDSSNRLEWSGIRRLVVRQYKKPKLLRGIALGVLGGLALGALTGYVSTKKESGISGGMSERTGIALGGGVGGLIGGIMGWAMVKGSEKQEVFTIENKSPEELRIIIQKIASYL